MSGNIELNYNHKNGLVIIQAIPEGNNPIVDGQISLGSILNSLGLTIEDCAKAIIVNTGSPTHAIHEQDRWQLDILPSDLTGRTVLDIGGYDGYVAEACLDRGASRAIVVDNMQYQGYTLPGFPHGWLPPRRYNGIEYVLGDLMDLSSWIDYAVLGDIVICYNVIYHVTNPLGALEQLRLITKNDLYLSTSVNPADGPMWSFNPDDSKTIYFTPTTEGLEAAFRFVGFEYEKLHGEKNHAIYHCKPVGGG